MPIGSPEQGLGKTLYVALIRPLRMCAEPIVLATSLFMALLYAIFYLFFEAYPIIFGGKKHHPSAGCTCYMICPTLFAEFSSRGVSNEHWHLRPCLHT